MSRERAPSFFASPPRAGEDGALGATSLESIAALAGSRRPASTPPPKSLPQRQLLRQPQHGGGGESFDGDGHRAQKRQFEFAAASTGSMSSSSVVDPQGGGGVGSRRPSIDTSRADAAYEHGSNYRAASPRFPRSPRGSSVGSSVAPSPRARQRRTSTVHQLMQPTEAFLGRSKYARAHATARPFAVIEEGFLMDTLLKWVDKYALDPEPPEPFSEAQYAQGQDHLPRPQQTQSGSVAAANESKSSAATSTAALGLAQQQESKDRKIAYAAYERRREMFEAKRVTARYAQFLHRALTGLRFSQHRSVASLKEIMRNLEHYLHDKWSDLQWQRNLDQRSKTSARQTLCQAELVLVCLTCLTELELLFNIVIKLADRVEESSRYWKSLDGSEWRFSIVTFGESFTSNATGNRAPDGRVHTVSERLDVLNSKLVAYMVILGQAKRLMREVYDIAHHDVELSRKYEELMDWAVRSFELVENNLDLSQLNAPTPSPTSTSPIPAMEGGDLSPSERSRIFDNDDLLDILDKMQRNASGATSELASPSPFLGPTLVRHLKEAIVSVPIFFEKNLREFQHLQKPGRLQRFWPEFLVGGLAIAGGIVWAQRSVSRQDVERSLGRLQRSAAEFISEHVTEPAEALYREVFLDQYIEVTDPAEVEDAKLSLQRCLRDFLVQKELKSLGKLDFAGGVGTWL